MDVDNMRFASAGPNLLNRGVKELGLRGNVVDWRAFSPIGYFDIRHVTQVARLKTGLRNVVRLFKRLPAVKVFRDSYAVHLYSNMWQEAGLDKNADYPPDSIYGGLIQKHLSQKV